MSKKKTLFLWGTAVIFSIIFISNAFFWKIVWIDGRLFFASTPFSKAGYEKGLGGRKNISASQAMLFKFSQKGSYSFWMKGMKFNIDVIWIDEGKIVHMKKDFPAGSEEAIAPPVPASSVLEIKSGLSDKYGFKIGDKVRIF